MSPVTSGPSVGSPPTLRVSLYTARLAAQGSGLRGRLGHIFLLSGSGQDSDDPVEAASRPCRTGVLSPSLEMKQCLTHAHTHTHGLLRGPFPVDNKHFVFILRDPTVLVPGLLFPT